MTMEQEVYSPAFSPATGSAGEPSNGHHPLKLNGFEAVGAGGRSLGEILASELPAGNDNLVPLNEVVDSVVNDIFERLIVLSKRLPALHETVRAREIFQFSLHSRRQVVKLLALVRWSKDATIVEKCKNIITFLQTQNSQLANSVEELQIVKTGISSTRVRNADILTAIDVLTTGNYQRLPSRFSTTDFLPPTSLSLTNILTTLENLNETIAYRLKVKDILPVEMKANYEIKDGRVRFQCEEFMISMSLSGGERSATWYVVALEFLFGVKESDKGLLEDFPRTPNPRTFDDIAHLSKLELIPAEGSSPDDTEDIPSTSTDEVETGVALIGGSPVTGTVDSKPKIVQGEERVVDAPLVRVFNLLQMLSMTYQLEILYQQSRRIASLGWGEFLQTDFKREQRILKLGYWPRYRGQQRLPNAPSPPALHGGIITITLSDSAVSKSPSKHILQQIEERIKTKPGERSSDKVLDQALNVIWEPDSRWIGGLDVSDERMTEEVALKVNYKCIDLESILQKAVHTHINTLILTMYKKTVEHDQFVQIYDLTTGDIAIHEEENGLKSLRIRTYAGQIIKVALDVFSGRIVISDLAFGVASKTIQQSIKIVNDNPSSLPETLIRVKLNTVMEFLEQKLLYLGFKVLKRLPIKAQEHAKFGTNAHLWQFVPIPTSPNHYFVPVLCQTSFRYALIAVRPLPTGDNNKETYTITEVGWIDEAVSSVSHRSVLPSVQRRMELGEKSPTPKFAVEIEDLRVLYSYCVARISSHKLEEQLKARRIAYTLVAQDAGDDHSAAVLKSTGQSLSIPMISVKAADVLQNVPAAVDVALPYIYMKVQSWADPDSACKVVTQLKLRSEPSLSQSEAGGIVRPSQNISFNKNTSVVSFITDDVNHCVGALQQEFGRVGKVAVIASAFKRLDSKDFTMTYFDLQTATFVYGPGFRITIGWRSHPESPLGGMYEIDFDDSQGPDPISNPHKIMAGAFQDLLNMDDSLSGLKKLALLLRHDIPVLALVQRYKDGAKMPNVTAWPKSVSSFSFVFENGTTRLGLDIHVVLQPKSAPPRYVILDSAINLVSPSAPHYAQLQFNVYFKQIPDILNISHGVWAQMALKDADQGVGKEAVLPPVMVVPTSGGINCSIDHLSSVLDEMAKACFKAG